MKSEKEINLKTNVPMTHDEKVVRERFKIGDVIRSVNPYWGEHSFTILRFTQHHVACVPNGSKHRPAWERDETTWSIGWGEFVDDVYDTFNYVKCSRMMRVWLCLLGNTYGRLS